MYQLENCPFCGETPKSNVYYSKCGSGTLELIAEIICKCGVNKRRSFQANDVPFDNFIMAFELVIDDWNRRVNK